jgi:hypothetical protein
MSKNEERKLAALLNGIAESVVQASDEEIISEVESEGLDVSREAERIRNLLKSSVTEFKKQRLAESKDEYKRKVAALNKSNVQRPNSSEERRGLLKKILEWKPMYQQKLVTAQYRNFEGLSQDDIDSLLKQFTELGILDEFLSIENGEGSDFEK